MENNHGICLQPFIPLRSEACEKSEMVTQLLFGEFYSILKKDSETRFAFIRADIDNYEGWIDEKTIYSLSYPEWDKLNSLPEKIVKDRYFRVVDKQKCEMWLTAGSTVSRATNNKYMATPLGVFELKYFFSRSMLSANGSACSGTAIRGLVRDIIEAENPDTPLSDVEVTRQLAEQGLVVARRTVTKYRQLLKIEAVLRRRRHS